jgi:hypothetical protein
MKTELKTELYKALKTIGEEKISESDKEELLRFFMVTKNSLIRNLIALLLSDVHYDRAVPYILEKINDKETFNDNGSLVHALRSFDMSGHLVQLVKIICEKEYEARLMAYGIVEEIMPKVKAKDREEALKILLEFQSKLESTGANNEENSTLHFIEQTIELISGVNRGQSHP